MVPLPLLFKRAKERGKKLPVDYVQVTIWGVIAVGVILMLFWPWS